MKIDTERVIIEVHFRPALWDKQNALYKNRDARAAAWLEICQEIIPDFDSLTKAEQKDFDKKIQQRWRTARDMYKKEKMVGNESSGSGAKKKKKYEYYQMLTFLDRVIDTATDDSLLPEGDDTDDVVIPSSHTKALSPPSTSAPLTPLPSASTSTNQQPIRPTQNKGKKAMSSFENTLLGYLKNNQLELESEDLAFFQSLQPTLKRFTTYQKMMFRTKVMQVIMEMEMPNINYSMSGSSSVTTPLSTPSPYDMGSNIPANAVVFASDITNPAYNTTSNVSGLIDNVAIVDGNTRESINTPVNECYTSASDHNAAEYHSQYNIETSIPANTVAFESDITNPAYNTMSYVSGPIDNVAIVDGSTPESINNENNKNCTPIPKENTARSETYQ
ncbi:hypothetical protein evm_014036 [Chilo suppressalis]|nr:hypothetical protein evm_014036 [Chilo suppressalis]